MNRSMLLSRLVVVGTLLVVGGVAQCPETSASHVASFSGSTCLQTTSGSAWLPTQTQTIESWVWVDPGTVEVCCLGWIAHARGADNIGWAIAHSTYQGDPGMITAMTSAKSTESSTHGNSASSTDQTKGAWFHWAAVVEETAASATETTRYVRTYINGVLDNQNSLTREMLPMVPGLSLYFGCDAEPEGTSDFRFRGRLSDFRIWNTLRTAQQILDNFHNAGPISSPNLVSRWFVSNSMADEEQSSRTLSTLSGSLSFLTCPPTTAPPPTTTPAPPTTSGPPTTTPPPPIASQDMSTDPNKPGILLGTAVDGANIYHENDQVHINKPLSVEGVDVVAALLQLQSQISDIQATLAAL